MGELYSLIRFLRLFPFSFYFCHKKPQAGEAPCTCTCMDYPFRPATAHCLHCGCASKVLEPHLPAVRPAVHCGGPGPAPAPAPAWTWPSPPWRTACTASAPLGVWTLHVLLPNLDILPCGCTLPALQLRSNAWLLAPVRCLVCSGADSCLEPSCIGQLTSLSTRSALASVCAAALTYSVPAQAWPHGAPQLVEQGEPLLSEVENVQTRLRMCWRVAAAPAVTCRLLGACCQRPPTAGPALIRLRLQMVANPIKKVPPPPPPPKG